MSGRFTVFFSAAASARLGATVRRRGALAWIALVMLVGLAALAGAATPSPTAAEVAAIRASVVYPAPSTALTFSHARHRERAIACAACHPAATASRSAVDLLVPTEAECRPCHAIDRARASVPACAGCHRGFAVGAAVARVQAEPAALKFSHAAHRLVECQRCHVAAPSSGIGAGRDAGGTSDASAGRDAPGLPSMSSCLSCHREGRQAARCTQCHLATASGRIDTSLGTGAELGADGSSADGASARRRAALRPASNLRGDAHGPGFASDHRAAAARADRTCGACHDESYCADCHAGTIRPMAFHPDAYLQVHAIAARRAASECSTCHRYQTFCVGCHERVGVGNRAASEWSRSTDGASGAGALAFHPAGWASSTGGDNLHAREARRNLSNCASCHREDDCLRCHSADAGGLRISPHPARWRGSLQCRALERGNRRMCLRCHVSDDEAGCDWAAP